MSPPDTPLDLIAFSDPQGKTIIGQAAQAQEGQIAWVATATEPGPVRWRIRTTGDRTALYDMAFWVDDPNSQECIDDRFSPSNTVKNAVKVDNRAGFVTRLKLCPGGEDWFRFSGEAFEELFVFVFGFEDEEPVTASLWRFEGADLVNVCDIEPDTTTCEPTSGGVDIKHLPQKNVDYYLHVRGEPGAVHHYDLVIGQQ